MLLDYLAGLKLLSSLFWFPLPLTESHGKRFSSQRDLGCSCNHDEENASMIEVSINEDGRDVY